MRLFIATEITGKAAEELRKVQEELSFEGTRPVKYFHITYKFLGEVDDNKIEWLKKELGGVKHEPFEAKVSEIGVFPSFKRINVVWAGLKPAESFEELYEKIDSVIGKEHPDTHEFVPHTTIARVKFVKDKEAFVNKIKTLELNEEKFAVNDFRLIKSTLTREGPVYEDLKVFKLA